jgi:hypothetical protein
MGSLAEETMLRTRVCAERSTVPTRRPHRTRLPEHIGECSSPRKHEPAAWQNPLVAGLAGGSNYVGGFSQTFTDLLPNGTAPTPLNIQLYFCPSGTCVAADFQSGKSITSSQSGSFTAATVVPEPTTISLTLLGGLLGALGSLRRKRA